MVSGVARGQLGALRPAGGERAGRVTGEDVCGPTRGSIVVVIHRPDHHRVAVYRHARAESVIISAIARGQLGSLCPTGGERAGRVARVHVRGPTVENCGILVVIFCPDHNRVAVDCDTVAEVVIIGAVARRQLCNLRPAGGGVAGCVARVHVRGPNVLAVIRADHHRVAVDRHATAKVAIRSAVARGQLGSLCPIGGDGFIDLHVT